MRKMPNLVPTAYWISNSLDNAEHNNTLLKIQCHPSYWKANMLWVEDCQKC